MQQSETLGELAAALAVAQGAFPSIERNREVEVKMKSGGKYSFCYATLDNIIGSVRKPLADNGLSYVQGINGSENGTVVETMLMHKSGQWIKTVIPVHANATQDNKSQALGSGITYAKRYALTALLGIVAEDDDDGNASDGNEAQTRKMDRPSNRSADDPKWRGPLGKSKLKADLTSFCSDIQDVEDGAQLIGMLTSNSSILEQCAADLPSWWVHDNGGVKVAITARAEQLKIKVVKYLDEFEKASEKKPVTQQAAE